jgi:hypothetical protein
MIIKNIDKKTDLLIKDNQIEILLKIISYH